ncbi:MAG: helix-turn-helix domain-containing protein [Candidatus Hydrogenedentes bacterium]|nr:helix-turn-helix domain-containing protein [Candidatus Hydrogenedentota bacterium]
MDKILTVNDVADVLKVKPITVREMFRENRLRAFKVGKAWRTTEQMLQEDIEYLARGENPPPLIPEASRTPKAAAQETAAAAPEAVVTPAAAPAGEAPKVAKPVPAPKPKVASETEETPQGLLF